MAMFFFPLYNCNIMYYITEMHVMSITFQLLLHYNKILQVGHCKTLLQDYQTVITTTIFLEFSIFCYKSPQYYMKQTMHREPAIVRDAPGTSHCDRTCFCGSGFFLCFKDKFSILNHNLDTGRRDLYS